MLLSLVAASCVAQTWVLMNNTNGVMGISGDVPGHVHMAGTVDNYADCEASCRTNVSCTIWTWSPNTRNCYWRIDGDYEPTPDDGYYLGCLKEDVPGCGGQPPCPARRASPDPSIPKTRPTIIENPVNATVVVERTAVHTLNDFRMIGVNFDFWPSDKAAWSTCGVLTSDLSNPDLIYLASQLSGSMLRLGGSPIDFLVYEVYDGACSAENLNKTQQQGPGGYFCPIWDQAPGQCLTMQRWDQINEFVQKTGLKLTFGLNACWERWGAKEDINFTLAEGLIKYTAGKWGSNLHGFEFGNECYGNIDPSVYGADMRKLASLIDTYYGSSGTKPTLIGPDNGADDMSSEYLDTMLGANGGVMQAATTHQYAEDCENPPQGVVLNISCLDGYVDEVIGKFLNVTEKHGVELWDGEGALHSNSGIDGWTNVFSSTFWYVHQLGRLSLRGAKLLSRQTLLGGNYELIDKATSQPYPDYWGVLLWHRLVGKSVYTSQVTNCDADCLASLRTFAFSSATTPQTTLIIMNFNTMQDFSLSITTSPVSVYQLTGDVLGHNAYLNEGLLYYNGGGPSGFPDIQPKNLTSGQSVGIPRASITYVVY